MSTTASGDPAREPIGVFVLDDHEMACLMFTGFSDEEAMLDSIMAGAAGYVLKQIRGSDLAGAVRAVASGRSLLDPRAASRLMDRLQARADGHHQLAGLSPRERATLELIGEGLTNRQISDRLNVSEKTVKNYVTTLFAKLGMQQRTQAAAYAARTVHGRAIEMSQKMRITGWKPQPRPARPSRSRHR